MHPGRGIHSKASVAHANMAHRDRRLNIGARKGDPRHQVDILVGRFVWEILQGDLYERFVWEILQGDLYERFVWEICMGEIYGRLIHPYKFIPPSRSAGCLPSRPQYLAHPSRSYKSLIQITKVAHQVAQQVAHINFAHQVAHLGGELRGKICMGVSYGRFPLAESKLASILHFKCHCYQVCSRE